MSKAIALENMVILILAVLLLGILLIIFFQYKSFVYSPIILFDRLVSMVRGWIVDAVLGLIWVLIGIFMVFIWTSSMCRSFPAGTAACAAISAVMVGLITYYTLSIAAGIPFFFMGPLKLSPTPKQLSDHLIDYALDSAAMINYGKGSPLYGTPQNPRLCMTLHLMSGKYVINDKTYSKLNTIASYNPLSAKSHTLVPSDSYWATFRVAHSVFRVRIYNNKLYVKMMDTSQASGYVTCVSGTTIGSNKEGTLGSNCENVRYYVGEISKNKYDVVLGNFKLKKDVYNKIYINYKDSSGKWVSKYIGDGNGPTITLSVDKGKPKTIYIEFFDEHFNAKFFSPECGNINHGEGVYICIPYKVS